VSGREGPRASDDDLGGIVIDNLEPPLMLTSMTCAFAGARDVADAA